MHSWFQVSTNKVNDNFDRQEIVQHNLYDNVEDQDRKV
jgi:hypothetical protein